MSATESSSIFTLSHNSNLQDILAANAKWASQMNNIQPTLFPDHNAKGQSLTLFSSAAPIRVTTKTV
ncbi:BBT_HP_G0131670.mRNA.1.CDS.1 [Saccharomyces cerevisiae]|nr:BBT_HP_G0131670.mRNA.1.CDS.1 [Saccharomyces cerevisiae]CAI6975350.1 BBT_HP_G0131670.mRNA.1.CDS.1 [Saccharomyces cerevisiae]